MTDIESIVYTVCKNNGLHAKFPIGNCCYPYDEKTGWMIGMRFSLYGFILLSTRPDVIRFLQDKGCHR